MTILDLFPTHRQTKVIKRPHLITKKARGVSALSEGASEILYYIHMVKKLCMDFYFFLNKYAYCMILQLCSVSIHIYTQSAHIYRNCIHYYKKLGRIQLAFSK